MEENSYVHFITVFLNKFLDNKPKGSEDSDKIDDNDDIDRDLDMEPGLLTITNVLIMNMMLLIFLQYNSIFIQNITHIHIQVTLITNIYIYTHTSKLTSRTDV